MMVRKNDKPAPAGFRWVYCKVVIHYIFAFGFHKRGSTFNLHRQNCRDPPEYSKFQLTRAEKRVQMNTHPDLSVL